MIHVIAFYLFAFVTLASAVLVIFARNPVHSVLWLILAFFNAAGLMVFILALGYYITPALVGGGADQMLSAFVATYTTDTGNWGLAAALGALLLATTGVLYAAAHKLSGGRVMAMG